MTSHAAPTFCADVLQSQLRSSTCLCLTVMLIRLQVFVWKEDLDAAAHEKPVDEFDINSLYWEPGQKSYMREHVGYEVLKCASLACIINPLTSVPCDSVISAHEHCWASEAGLRARLVAADHAQALVATITVEAAELSHALLQIKLRASAESIQLHSGISQQPAISALGCDKLRLMRMFGCVSLQGGWVTIQCKLLLCPAPQQCLLGPGAVCGGQQQ